MGQHSAPGAKKDVLVTFVAKWEKAQMEIKGTINNLVHVISLL